MSLTRNIAALAVTCLLAAPAVYAGLAASAWCPGAGRAPQTAPGSETARAAPPPMHAQGEKILLRPQMVINEVAAGDAGALVDEQAAAGDPRAGHGGSPVHSWQPGWRPFDYPASAVIDLGAPYHLTSLYLYDGTGTGKLVVSAGTPFAWKPLFADPLTAYNAWVGHPLDVVTRYLQLSFQAPGAAVNEIVLYGTPAGRAHTSPPARQHPPQPPMDQFIGVNGFIDDPPDRLAAAGFVREYHNWNWDEGDLWPFRPELQHGYPGYPHNLNKFNPSYAGGGWRFDDYYRALRQMGITVCPVIQGSASWLSASFGSKPVPPGSSTTDPASYAAHADHMFQYAARYGSRKVPQGLLKLAPDQPRRTGMGLLHYYEDWNEPDNWWEGANAHFAPYEYAAMASADRDGHRGAMGATFGVRNADPAARLVMAGLADPSLDYLRAMSFWAQFHRHGSFPADVINLHHYSNAGSDRPIVGISPEEDGLLQKMAQFVQYRNQHLPEAEVWVTEFGYDTNPASPQRAPSIGGQSPEEVQGEWIVRSFLALAAAGVDRAAVFMLRDVNSKGTNRFDTCGLTSDQASGYRPKPSWYYVYTLKTTLKGMRFAGEAPSQDARVRIYRFKRIGGPGGAFALWCPTSNGTAVDGYRFTLPQAATHATLVELHTGSIHGVTSDLRITSRRTTLRVTERPVFVVVDRM